jgi:hypothetical protein
VFAEVHEQVGGWLAMNALISGRDTVLGTHRDAVALEDPPDRRGTDPVG